MTGPAVLTPAMVDALRLIGEGRDVDGRSWRAVTSLVCRGLVSCNDDTNRVLTPAGVAALEDYSS